MNKQLSASLIFGIAAAVTLGVASTASAQSTSTDSTTRTTRTTRTKVTSSQRIPVRKDASGATTTSEAAGAIATPNADSLRADSIAQANAALERARQDSIANVERMRQDSIAAVERARQDSIALAERMRADSIARADSLMRWNAAHRRLAGTGLYFQIAAGAAIPQGTFNDFFQRGYDVTGSVGYHPRTSPLGVRFDVGYDKFNARSNIIGNTSDPTAWSGLGELTLRVPSMWAVSPYVVGGGGVTRFSNYGTSGGSDSMTKGQWNIGGGIGFGLANVKLFVESRYMRVMTPGEATTFVPVVLGISL